MNNLINTLRCRMPARRRPFVHLIHIIIIIIIMYPSKNAFYTNYKIYYSSGILRCYVCQSTVVLVVVRCRFRFFAFEMQFHKYFCLNWKSSSWFEIQMANSVMQPVNKYRCALRIARFDATIITVNRCVFNLGVRRMHNVSGIKSRPTQMSTVVKWKVYKCERKRAS